MYWRESKFYNADSRKCYVIGVAYDLLLFCYAKHKGVTRYKGVTRLDKKGATRLDIDIRTHTHTHSFVHVIVVTHSRHALFSLVMRISCESLKRVK